MWAYLDRASIVAYSPSWTWELGTGVMVMALSVPGPAASLSLGGPVKSPDLAHLVVGVRIPPSNLTQLVHLTTSPAVSTGPF